MLPVARALQVKPEESVSPACTDLPVRAGRGATPGERITRAGTQIEIASATFNPQGAASGASKVLAQLLAQAAEELPPPEPPTWLTGPNGESILQGRFHASLPPQGTEAKFEGFRRQWNAKLTQATENSLTYYLGVPTCGSGKRLVRPAAGIDRRNLLDALTALATVAPGHRPHSRWRNEEGNHAEFAIEGNRAGVARQHSSATRRPIGTPPRGTAGVGPSGDGLVCNAGRDAQRSNRRVRQGHFTQRHGPLPAARAAGSTARFEHENRTQWSIDVAGRELRARAALRRRLVRGRDIV